MNKQTFEQETAEAMCQYAARVAKVQAGVSASYEIDMSSFLTSDKDNILVNLKSNLSNSKTAIYTIALPDTDPVLVHAALTKVRDQKLSDRCYSRVLPLPEHPTSVLYVGSSRDLIKRMMEHFGYGAKKTYSLHLLCWAQDFGRMTINARFYDSGIDQHSLCALEDHLAHKLIPLFGKRGSV